MRNNMVSKRSKFLLTSTSYCVIDIIQADIIRTSLPNNIERLVLNLYKI